ncbi:MAG: Ig-like domain-containing protein [Geobacteraceae bacterium]|nr:Ig-like domain-containing protein [Geobacteraceae bacterium]
MQLLCMLRHISRYSIILVTLTTMLIYGCGGSGSSPPPAPNIEWAQVTSISTSTTTASLQGTSWVSNSYYASHCIGLACFIDTTRTNDYPGVDVTYVNLTTGVTGHAISYYGPGTNWVHKWSADVPVVGGSNTIQISAYDPGGKGGTMTFEVIPPPPLTVLSTTPLSGATGVLLNTTIAAQLSDTIHTGSYSFLVNGPTGAVAGTRTVNESTVTFTPASQLSYNTTYTVTIPTSLRSLSGSSLMSDYTWSFTTMAFPVFGVLTTYPSSGATNVPTNQTVSAMFNGEIDPASIAPSSFFVSDLSGVRWSYYYNVYGSTVSVNGYSPLQANTTYTATLTTAIRDKSGHSLPFDYVWTFKSGN